MNVNDKKLDLLRNGKVSSVLLKMGVPTMLGMLISSLYSIVDAYFASWLGIPEQGAVAVAFPILQIIIGIGLFFGAGAASYISRLLGRGDTDSASRTASTAIFSSIATGLFLSAVVLVFLEPVLTAFGASGSILPFALSYGIIYIGGAVFTIFNIAMNNIAIAEGRSRFTMAAMILGGGLNVVFDPLFMFGLNMGITGAAVATVTAQAVTSVFCLWYIVSKKGVLRFSLRLFTPNAGMLKEIFTIGMPVLAFQLLTSMALGLTNVFAQPYGDSAVAAFGNTARLMTFGSYVVFGFLKGFSPAAGFNYGARDYLRVKMMTNTALLWTTAFCVAVSGIMIFLPEQILSIFVETDQLFIETGVKILQANGVVFAFFGLQQVAASLFLAMGKGVPGGLLTMSRQGIFFLPALFVLPSLFGIDGLVWVQPVADICTVILSAVLLRRAYQVLNRSASGSGSP